MSPFAALVLQAIQGIKHTAACDDSAPDESWNCICGRELRVAEAVASMVNAAVDSTFTSCAVLGVRASDNTIAKARAAALRAATGPDNDGTSWNCPDCGTNVKGPSRAPLCPHCGKLWMVLALPERVRLNSDGRMARPVHTEPHRSGGE